MLTTVARAYWAVPTPRAGRSASNWPPRSLMQFATPSAKVRSTCPTRRARGTGSTGYPAATEHRPAILFPRSTADVQQMVRLANEHHVALWPTSTGENAGLGELSPVREGQAVMHLGARMNRIVEVDETLGYAVVEPGVTFSDLRAELGRRGDKFMISSTSGPPDGSILGNALDRGAGYTPYFDHFGMTSGLEVVLPDRRRNPHRRRRHWYRDPLSPQVPVRPRPRRSLLTVELRHRDGRSDLADAPTPGDPLVRVHVPRRRRPRGNHRARSAAEARESRSDAHQGDQRDVRAGNGSDLPLRADGRSDSPPRRRPTSSSASMALVPGRSPGRSTARPSRRWTR